MSKNVKKYPQNNPRGLQWLNRMEANIPSSYGPMRQKARFATSIDSDGWEWLPEYKEKTKLDLEMFEKRYWDEFFVFIDKDTGEKVHSLEFAKPYIIDALWANSGVALKYSETLDQWYVYRITMFWLNPSYQIETCDGLIYSYPTDFTNQMKYFEVMNKMGMKAANTPMVLSTPTATPWAWGIDMWAQRWWERWNSGDINVANSINIKAISSDDNITGNKISEIKSFHSGKSPLSIWKGPFDEITDLGLENRQADIWADIDNLWKNFCRMRGIRHNFDFKRERNVSGEVGNNDAVFVTCEGQRFRTLQYLIDNVNRIYGKNYAVTTLIDEYEKKNQMIQSIPEVVKAESDEEFPEEKDININKREIMRR